VIAVVFSDKSEIHPSVTGVSGCELAYEMMASTSTAHGTREQLLLAAVAALVVVLVSSSPASAQPAPDARLGQGAQCRKCHKEVVDAFPATLHGQSVKFPIGSDAATCEACHGNAAKHVKSGKAEDIAYNRDAETAACLSCHGKEARRHAWNGSAHDRADMSCRSCHSGHHSTATPMLRLSVPDVCFTCHKDLQNAPYQRSTHIFRTEQRTVKVACSSCHDPHGGQGRAMMVASSTNQVCYTCHADKRGPFLWEHPPVREDCSTCHIPHGSNHPKLLRAQTHMLCQSCHLFMLSRHQTVAGFDVYTFNRGCVNCHSQIHGSNHPSGKGLTN